MDAEKQEGQKTVVAFITGLLIGGLLVWVFSSTPDTKPQTDNETATTTEESTDNEASVSGALNGQVTTDDDEEGAIDVKDQSAGTTVVLEDVSYPSTDGWIVVRDFANGVQGKILGAARYSTSAGLTPTSVSLLRSTVKGNTYQVMFYTENGDKKFSTPADTPVSEGAVTFEAK